MITKYNSNYNELFAKANQQLGAAENPIIHTLEEYFYKLRDLVYGPNGDAENPNYEFLKIPLDEPHFEVDLNTRNIKVPEVFRQNGISVTGDQMAELLFFEVDRFFDATDLMNTDIYILWSSLGDNKINKTAAFDPQAFSIKETEYNEKIIFGWPISDDITAAAGKIKIAIQFEIKQGDAVIYNLSTLPKEVSINAGLEFNGRSTSSQVFIDYLRNHVANSDISTNIDEAAIPQFVYWGYKFNDQYHENEDTISENLTEGSCLYAYAIKNGQGTIKYQWDTLGYEVPSSDTGIFVRVTNLSALNDYNPIYWIKTENGYKIAKQSDPGDRYLLCSKLDYGALKAGQHTTTIQNHVTNSISSIGATALTWTIEGPEDPDDISMENVRFTEEVELTADFKINKYDVPTYTWYKDGEVIEGKNERTLTTTEEGQYRVTAQTTRNQGVSKEATSNTFYVVTVIKPLGLTINNDNGTLSVVFDRELSSFENPTYRWTVDGVQKSTNDTISIDQNGHYVVYVTITKVGLPSEGSETTFNASINIQN